MTAKCAKALKLALVASSDKIVIQTFTGKSCRSATKTTLTVNDVEFQFLVVDVGFTIDNASTNLDDIWPNLDTVTKTEVTANFVAGSVNVIIGIDQLYAKVTKNAAIAHGSKGLIILNTIFGTSLGGSNQMKLEA